MSPKTFSRISAGKAFTQPVTDSGRAPSLEIAYSRHNKLCIVFKLFDQRH